MTEQILAQSNAINRYVGKLTDLYPSDPWQAALCDEIMEAVEDITTKIAATIFLPRRAKESAAQGAGGRPAPILSHEATAEARSTWRPVLRCRPLSVADLKVFVLIRHLKSGVLDHVPADLPDRVAPKLVEHYERIKNDPRVKAYYAKHGVAG